MRIIRSKVARDFTVMRNTWIRNTMLSAKAKGIFAYLLTLPDNWDLHITELITHFTDGERAIRSGLHELTSEGYVYCVTVRNPDGKITGNEYYLIENPKRKQDMQNVDVDSEALLSTKGKLSTNKTIVDLTKYVAPIETLNELTGRSFRLDNRTALSNIKARVKDGSPIEEIIEVIKFICKKRMGTEFEMFLRPSTVFNKTKYENYLEEYKYLTKDGKYAILNTGTFLNKAQALKDLD